MFYEQEEKIAHNFIVKMLFNYFEGSDIELQNNLGAVFYGCKTNYLGSKTNKLFDSLKKKNIKPKRYVKGGETLYFEGQINLEFKQIFKAKSEYKLFLNTFSDELPVVKKDWKFNTGVKVFSKLLNLTPNETLVLQLAYVISCFEQKFTDHLGILVQIQNDYKNKLVLFNKILKISTKEVSEILSNSIISKLNLWYSIDSANCFFALTKEYYKKLSTENLTTVQLENLLFPMMLPNNLTLENYSDKNEEISLVEKIINNSLKHGSIGTNVIFYGEPGTGKTELVMALGKKNNWNIRSIGDIDNNIDVDDYYDSNYQREQRMYSLLLARKLYSNKNKKTVLLFDEMEDLFIGKKSFSKAFLNRFLETTGVPIIWTCNDLSQMGHSLLRRMTTSIKFDIPTSKTRKDVWNFYNDSKQLSLDDTIIDDLANTYDISPSMIHTASNIIKSTKVTANDVPKLIKNLDTLVNFGEERKFQHSLSREQKNLYDVNFINSNLNINDFSEKLLSCKPNFTVCLYGPPGTGKSAYAQYIAEKMGKKFILKKSSDLISKWVGETEKNIAKSFKEAGQNKDVLILDEADSFLRSRLSAKNSWEITQTNELLTQMETHDQPFFCTTNLIDDFDEASLRRFTFKIKFDFLKSNQIINMFRKYFNCEPPDNIDNLSSITPGDFYTVLKRSNILNITNPKELVKMLEEEVQHKKDKQIKKMGF